MISPYQKVRIPVITGFVVSFLLFIVTNCTCNPDTDRKNESIPQLWITTDTVIGKEKKTDCRILYTENGDTIIRAGKIKYRGASSGKYPKHSMSLELENKNSLGKLPADKDWILNANYIDKTMMRHKLCFDLFREMNPHHIVASSTYIWVTENNASQGLYVLMEEIDKSKTGLNKKDPQAMLFKEPALFYRDSVPTNADSDFFHQKFPKPSKSDKTAYLSSFQQFLLKASEEDFSQQIHTWVDLDNIIDWHILLLFSNNQDGLLKNFYLYKLNSDTPFRIIPWDYDHSFGRDGDNTLNMLKRNIRCEDNLLLHRLMNNPKLNYKTLLFNRWKELRAKGTISLKNIQKHIRANELVIHNFRAANEKLWPTDDLKFYKDKNNYRQELKLIERYTQLRIAFLDDYLMQLSKPH